MATARLNDAPRRARGALGTDTVLRDRDDPLLVTA